MTRPSRRRTAVALALVAGLGGGLLAPATGSGPAAAPAGAPHAVQPLPGEWWWKAMGIDELHRTGTGKGVTVAVIDGPIDPRRPRARGQGRLERELLPRPRGRTDPPSARPSGDRPGRRARDEHGRAHRRHRQGHRPRRPGHPRHRPGRHDPALRRDATRGRRRAAAAASSCRTATTSTGPSADAIAQAADDGADVINISLVSGYNPKIDGRPLRRLRARRHRRRRAPRTRAASQWPGLGNGVVLVNTVGPDGPDPRLRGRRAALTSPSPRPARTSWPRVYDASGWHSERHRLGRPRSPRRSSAAASPPSARRTRDATAGQVLHAVKDNVGLRGRRAARGTRRGSGGSGRDLRGPDGQHGLRLGHLRPRRRRGRSTPRPCRRTTRSSARATAEDPGRRRSPPSMGARGTARPGAGTATPSAARRRAPARGRPPPAPRSRTPGTPWLPVALGAVLVLRRGRRLVLCSGAAARVPPRRPRHRPTHRRPPRTTRRARAPSAPRGGTTDGHPGRGSGQPAAAGGRRPATNAMLHDIYGFSAASCA